MEKKNKKNKKNEIEPMSNKDVVFMSLQIGFSVSFSAVFFTLVGRYIDKRVDTAPWLTILGAIIGFLVSMYFVWQIVKPLQKIKNTK